MARMRPTAEVSRWLASVAEVLPLSHNANRPYSLGEAVAELGAYAQAIGVSDWNFRAAKRNRASLRAEIEAQKAVVGKRLGVLIVPTLDDLRDDSDPVAVSSSAARFTETWHSRLAIAHAFRDLCDAAKMPGVTRSALRKRAAIVASQVGSAAQRAFSPLSHAADALVETEQALARWWDAEFASPLTEADRLRMATEVLVSPPSGRVVVWLVYFRATIYGMRESAASMTFLRPEWALPNAYDVELEDFPERAELRRIRKEVHWMDELLEEALKPENRLVLVRVGLGERLLAGALEEARRRVEAVLGVAVNAGGTSWQSAGAACVLLDGEVRSSSLGLRVKEDPAQVDDSYGISATAEILSSVLRQLGDALAVSPMPDHLIDALTSLREARMTDHRDVLFHGARRVSPRIATALEDHAMELFASVLKVPPTELAAAVQRHETLDRAGRRVASQLMAPFNEAWALEHHEGREELERRIAKFSPGGVQLVSFSKAVALRDELRALPMTDLQRGDVEEAIEICTDPNREREFLEEIWRETGLVRARHRRVRNAVNHGLPLDEIALASIRKYADDTSRTALNIALTWYQSGVPGATLLQKEQDAWISRMRRIDAGENWVSEDAQIGDES